MNKLEDRRRASLRQLIRLIEDTGYCPHDSPEAWCDFGHCTELPRYRRELAKLEEEVPSE